MTLLRSILAPLLGIAALFLVWTLLASVPDTSLPGPMRTWEASKLYVLHPLTKRGENDQGILLFAVHSLELVAKGYGISMIVAIPLGFAIGLSPFFSRLVDPVMQLFRPVSPLAWRMSPSSVSVAAAPVWSPDFLYRSSAVAIDLSAPARSCEKTDDGPAGSVAGVACEVEGFAGVDAGDGDGGGGACAPSAKSPSAS